MGFYEKDFRRADFRFYDYDCFANSSATKFCTLDGWRCPLGWLFVLNQVSVYNQSYRNQAGEGGIYASFYKVIYRGIEGYALSYYIRY